MPLLLRDSLADKIYAPRHRLHASERELCTALPLLRAGNCFAISRCRVGEVLSSSGQRRYRNRDAFLELGYNEDLERAIARSFKKGERYGSDGVHEGSRDREKTREELKRRRDCELRFTYSYFARPSRLREAAVGMLLPRADGQATFSRLRSSSPHGRTATIVGDELAAGDAGAATGSSTLGSFSLLRCPPLSLSFIPLSASS